MRLTPHDVMVLRLASREPEGRLGFLIDGQGCMVMASQAANLRVHADPSVPRLEALGLLARAVGRAYVLTPEGWDVVRLDAHQRAAAAEARRLAQSRDLLSAASA